MSKKKQQERKDKKRKAKAQSRVEAKRKQMRKAVKKANEEAKLKEHFRVKLDPIKNDSKNESKNELEPRMSPQTPVEDVRKSEWALKKLEHNMKILEALERELEEEANQRDAMQQTLKEKGLETMRDQMDYLAKTAEDHIGVKKGKKDHSLKSKKGKLSGSAKVRYSPPNKHNQSQKKSP